MKFDERSNGIRAFGLVMEQFFCSTTLVCQMTKICVGRDAIANVCIFVLGCR